MIKLVLCSGRCEILISALDVGINKTHHTQQVRLGLRAVTSKCNASIIALECRARMAGPCGMHGISHVHINANTLP